MSMEGKFGRILRGSVGESDTVESLEGKIETARDRKPQEMLGNVI
jgi:hypothetical protein